MPRILIAFILRPCRSYMALSFINSPLSGRGFAVDIDSYGIIETVGRIDRLENDVRDVLDSGLTAKSQGAELFVLS